MSQKITKQILKDTIMAVDDPTYLASLVQDIVDELPANLSAYLCKRMFIKHSHPGKYYEVYNRRTQTTEYFLFIKDVFAHIKQSKSTVKKASVYNAINSHTALFGYFITKKEPTLK